MPIFEANASSLDAVPATSFAEIGMKERADHQRLLATRIEALEQGLMVLGDEFSGWADSRRRIDLLCLATDANLVVVELKRDEDGGHMDLQALRYAAMVSTMTFDKAVATLARYLNGRAPDEAVARKAILDHLGWVEPREDEFAQETRIILAAAGFGEEITTTVLWPRDRYEVDISCVRMWPHRMADGRLLLDIHPLIPLPEARDYQTQLGVKQNAERKEHSERDKLTSRFWESLLQAASLRTALPAGHWNRNGGELWNKIGRDRISLAHVIRKSDGQAELRIDRKVADGATAFVTLKAERAAIEDTFGGSLEWAAPSATTRGCIFHRTEGGYLNPESEWPLIQDRTIEAMVRLDAAVRPRVAKLP